MFNLTKLSSYATNLQNKFSMEVDLKYTVCSETFIMNISSWSEWCFDWYQSQPILNIQVSVMLTSHASCYHAI